MSNSSRARRQSVAVVSGGGGNEQATQSTIRDAATLSSAISTLKNENILLKYGRNGKAELRAFFISQDCSCLQWRGKSGVTSISLREMKEIRLGQTTDVFRKDPRHDLVQSSFSLIFPDRSIDLVASNPQERNTWVYGLQQVHEMLAGSKAGQELNYLLSVGAEGTAAAASSDVHSVNRKSSVDTLDGHAPPALKSAAALQADSHMKHVDVYTWGSGASGVLGRGVENASNVPKVIQALVGQGVKTVCCGTSHTLALTETMEVLSWGDGCGGVLGHGDEVVCALPAKIQGLDKREICVIAAALQHCAAVSRDGCCFTWGNGGSGRLGHGDEWHRWKPTPVSALAHSHVTFVACGPASSAAIDTNGQLYLWGDNFCGQLFPLAAQPEKTGAELEILLPRLFGGLPAGMVVTQVALGAYHTAAIASMTCDLYMWGDNTKGQLGSGDKKAYSAPFCATNAASPMQGVHSVVCGEMMTAAIDAQGRLFSWGVGPLGLGYDVRTSKPTLVRALAGQVVVQVAVSINHGVALSQEMRGGDGSTCRVWVWGTRSEGKLGLGDELLSGDEGEPRLLDMLSTVQGRAVACGRSHTVALCSRRLMAEADSRFCMQCQKDFNWSRRPKHCHSCGGLFCDSCSTQRLTLLRLGYSRPMRVCDNCSSSIATGIPYGGGALGERKAQHQLNPGTSPEKTLQLAPSAASANAVESSLSPRATESGRPPPRRGSVFSRAGGAANTHMEAVDAALPHISASTTSSAALSSKFGGKTRDQLIVLLKGLEVQLHRSDAVKSILNSELIDVRSRLMKVASAEAESEEAKAKLAEERKRNADTLLSLEQNMQAEIVALKSQLRALQNGLPAAAGRRMSLELLGDSGGTRRRSIGAGDEEKARLDAQRELNKMQLSVGPAVAPPSASRRSVFDMSAKTIEGSEDVETGDGLDAQANSSGLGAVQGAADRPGDPRVLSPHAGGGHTAAAVQQISERGRTLSPPAALMTAQNINQFEIIELVSVGVPVLQAQAMVDASLPVPAAVALAVFEKRQELNRRLQADLDELQRMVAATVAPFVTRPAPRTPKHKTKGREMGDAVRPSMSPASLVQ